MQIHNIIEQVDRRQSAMTALGELQLPNEGTLPVSIGVVVSLIFTVGLFTRHGPLPRHVIVN